jgi:hypothetical protein
LQPDVTRALNAVDGELCVSDRLRVKAGDRFAMTSRHPCLSRKEGFPYDRRKLLQVVLALLLLGLGFQLVLISSESSVSSLSLGPVETGIFRLDPNSGEMVYRYRHLFSDQSGYLYWLQKKLLVFVEVQNVTLSLSSEDPFVVAVDQEDREIFTGHFRPEERAGGVRFAFDCDLNQNASYAIYIINKTSKSISIKADVYPIVQVYRIERPYVWEGFAIMAIGFLCLWLTARQ